MKNHLDSFDSSSQLIEETINIINMKSYSEFIKESSLSRIYQKVKEFDTGAITGFRNENTYAVNKEKNREILAYLLSRGYSVTKVRGSYIENYDTPDAKEVNEESFFVVDQQRSGTLKRDLILLGRKYDQDSILWAENGKPAVVIGTSKREKAWPKFNEVKTVGQPNFGYTDGQFFSRVRNRPFFFESAEEETLPPTLFGKWTVGIIARDVEKGFDRENLS